MAEAKTNANEVEVHIVFNGDKEAVKVPCELGNLPRVQDVLKKTSHKKGTTYMNVLLNGVACDGTTIVNDGDVLILSV